LFHLQSPDISKKSVKSFPSHKTHGAALIFDSLAVNQLTLRDHGYAPSVYINQGCARGFFSRDRGETDTLKLETEAETEALTIQAETRPRQRPSELETETRPRRILTPRLDRAEALLRLETASRPRRQDRGHIPDINRLGLFNLLFAILYFRLTFCFFIIFLCAMVECCSYIFFRIQLLVIRLFCICYNFVFILLSLTSRLFY